MADRIFLANVGVNASHRFSSPIFPDATFEFIPIPEDRDPFGELSDTPQLSTPTSRGMGEASSDRAGLPGTYAVRYRDLRSFYGPERALIEYVPERLWDWPVHNDPEFMTFTYGDNCETSPRAASLKRLEAGDFLFFIARLQHSQTKEHGFYLIGFLAIDEVLRAVGSRPKAIALRRFGANAHVRRGLSDPKLWDRFWVFGGSNRSRRFRQAVPVTRELADRAFTTADGSPWKWPKGRTELQVIGAYTRSCRCVMDPALPGHAERAGALWEWVGRHSSSWPDFS